MFQSGSFLGVIMKIIGRKQEQERFKKILASKEAEFVVVYGRRRVGKTFLVREYFNKQRCHFLQATGMQKGAMSAQLQKFTEAYANTFYDGIGLKDFVSWRDAFHALTERLRTTKTPCVIFLDEFPWMATDRSQCLQELEYYWNQYWVQMPHVKLILCGSSASWLIKKIIYDTGGLHNRTTCQIRLLPFTLRETECFLKAKGVHLNRDHVLQLYMAMGGIPFYLKCAESGLTATEIIQHCFFAPNALLSGEFDKLFASLFTDASVYVELVELLSTSHKGLSRSDIACKATLSSNGGRLSERLNDLQEAGFIEVFVPFGKKTGETYKLLDPFCLFHLRWLGVRRQKYLPNHWSVQAKAPQYHVWAGYAFENVCLQHVHQIITALDFVAGGTISSWRYAPKHASEQGAQIDLLIDRDDGAIMLVEIKYTNTPFVIDKAYAEKLQQKITVFRKQTKTEKHILLVMVSAKGLKQTLYVEALVNRLVTIDHLFV